MLTATPLHNRLWDLYSLVHLLSVARGHDNPFGSEGLFARRSIGDDRTRARKLNPRMKDEFRSIVYQYMSRVRRGDANLHFPQRIIQLHKVEPTPEERQLIALLAKPVRELKNRYSQIGILQSLTSSPHALRARLKNMARNGTFPADIAATVEEFVDRMPASAKLRGLGALVDHLSAQRPDDWRMVVFTGFRQTQTTIQEYLEGRKIPVGIINGDSGSRNQDTIRRFWKMPRECRVIVSTEAGAEGVNLQAANVLVNYDLPWNPMIVEQRIGRIQRLASEHANVAIFNIILNDTFESFIVGRLMEKLQLAAHAVGDVEALLEAAGLDEDDDGTAKSFEEKILELVTAALAGKDVEAAARKAAQSIDEATRVLEREKKLIDDTLGGMDGAEYVGPRAPKLPPVERSLEPVQFVRTALEAAGARLTMQSPGIYLCEKSGTREQIQIADHTNGHFAGDGPVYAPGTAAFERLVGQIITTGMHSVEDLDREPLQRAEERARQWVATFDGTHTASPVAAVHRCIEGTALVRVRATVAHDSYERLVEVPCSPTDHTLAATKSALDRLADVIRLPASIGVNPPILTEHAAADPGIAEFCRFYSQRKAEELRAAGDDDRKRKKLDDEFTPRLEFDLAALQGQMHRQVQLRVGYRFEGGPEYTSTLTIVPRTGEIVAAPTIGVCAQSGQRAPNNCLARCEVTGQVVLDHLLSRSELSGRRALPEHTALCTMSNKRALMDELEPSAVTDKLVSRALLKTSALSGKRAEPDLFARCEFTGSECLKTELAKSGASGKLYRLDEEVQSTVSGKRGHKLEFVACWETRQPLLATEAERCGATGKMVRPGVLEQCAISGQWVLPSELERSAVSGTRALKRYFVSSSRTGIRLLEREAVVSVAGAFCSPSEARLCRWAGETCHPDDVTTCGLTGTTIHRRFATKNGDPVLLALTLLLDGFERAADNSNLWPAIEAKAAHAMKVRRSRVEAAQASPNGGLVAISLEVPTFLGLGTQHAGCLYSIADQAIVGRIVRGKRKAGRWIAARH
jgi:hypothetical protein